MVIYLDLSKAFDRINHEILGRRFEEAGFEGEVRRWLDSYMKNRTHFTRIRKADSDRICTTNGIPQGSVLGAALLHVNSLCGLKIDGKIICYADDTALMFSAKNDANLLIELLMV